MFYFLKIFWTYTWKKKGQAITDSVLVRIIPSKWDKYEILTNDASIIKLQPGVVGGFINSVLGKQSSLSIPWIKQ